MAHYLQALRDALAQKDACAQVKGKSGDVTSVGAALPGSLQAFLLDRARDKQHDADDDWRAVLRILQTSSDDRILRRPDVEALTGLRRSALYAAMERGDFPRPIRLTAKAVGWKLSSIVSWIASREVASTQERNA